MKPLRENNADYPNCASNIILPGDTGKRLERAGRMPVFQKANIWGHGLERQIRDLRAARAALERRRRRHRHGPPLCSTTFGGSTVPPIFGGGGGGFLQGDIRIGSVGADFISPAGGTAATVMPAATANVGDELWQFIHASGTWTNPAGWTQKFGGAGVLFNRFRVYSRVADGTASDDFTMPANTLFYQGKQWSLQEVLPFDTWPSFAVQGGIANSASTLAWDVGFPPGTALTASVAGDPAKFVQGYFACQDRQQPATVTPTSSDSNPENMENIATINAFALTGGLSVDTELTIINFQYVVPSIAYIEYTLGRTPGAPNTYSQYTQYQRYQIF